ncbi:class I SAM-dependent methyltransferase [Paenibacillus radicis (ex Xue et al. 2023)]|uniref:Class I SAM-dependent methyltransferase n=1 Tax=Paenibacillus radicis (ex Xue et al. 2023) TaxID=2972489 RepID=A0ABT1YMF4_9BACL|nr:class I SAM-dependent methyltransferase [Paenibacillus radicis (ex Xue et al. 2023)]MCR8634361.1 class I SAM-dependent methyltransferase [Paenibacillus radicis (ex Xue et al. 2023)]
MVSIVYVSWRNGISPMPSSAPTRLAVANEINQISGRGTIVEAGSGWGTLALHLMQHCPGWRIIGIENSPVPLWVSRTWVRVAFPKISGNSEASAVTRDPIAFIRGDIYDYPYESADVVVCYLYPGAMKRLSVILGERLAPNARIVSICFALPGWRPERVVTCGDVFRTKVYVYTMEGNDRGAG